MGDEGIKIFYCVYCQDVASLRMGDFAQFHNHMETVHRVFYEFDILLAINFIERIDKEDIIEKVKINVGKVKKKVLKDNRDLEKVLPSKETTFSTQQSIVVDKNLSNEANTSEKVLVSSLLSSTELIKGFQETPVPGEDQIEQKITTDTNIEAPPINKQITENPDGVACDMCGKWFSEYGLKYHQRSSKECAKNITKCDDCSRTFLNQKSVRKHIKFYQVKGKSCRKQVLDLTCKNCTKFFASRLSLVNHKFKPTPCEKIITCKCGKLVKESMFKRHVLGKNCQQDVELKCKQCLKEFISAQKARSHYKRTEVNPGICQKRVACQKCEKKMSEEDYSGHRCILVTADLKCKDCLYTFSSKLGMKLHLQNAENACRKRIKCDKCGVTVREIVYAKHISRDCVALPCDRCGEKFKRREMKLHKQRKTMCKPIVTKCEFCDEVTDDHTAYQKHMQVIHNIFNKNLEIKTEFHNLKTELANVKLEEKMEYNVCFGCDKNFEKEFDVLIHQKMKKDCPAYDPNIDCSVKNKKKPLFVSY